MTRPTKKQGSIEELLSKLPTLPGFQKLAEAVIAQRHPIPDDGHHRVYLEPSDELGDDLDYEVLGRPCHTYMVVIPKEEDAGQEVILEAWGAGTNLAKCERIPFSKIPPALKKKIRTEIASSARWAESAD